eukprot:TRINITY_DN79837_c0_g1_i1.p1 TRINITY_DN79837_c0_g1~~TRINITY_DN79837_c0_g1_i1.p1  ORF type:complete len:314 (-),score=79.56 TRINITY_DN79837_c0_g1_i1:369-1310(-)
MRERRPRSARSAWSADVSAAAARARRFSDAPCPRGCSRCSNGSWACSGLHKRVLLLRRQKDELHLLADAQRRDLRKLEAECGRLRSNAELVQADLAMESCSRWCAADITRLELEQLRSERRQLENELESWRNSPAKLRSSRRAEAQHAAAREAWFSERRRLEQDVASEQARLATLEEELSWRREHESEERALRASAVRALREDAAERRRLCADAERELWDAEAALAARRKKNGTYTSSALQADEGRLAKAKAELARESEERRLGTDELRRVAQELEALRQELKGVEANNVQLRSGLQWTIDGLEKIQREPVAF